MAAEEVLRLVASEHLWRTKAPQRMHAERVVAPLLDFFFSPFVRLMARWRIRPPSFVNLSAIPKMVEGHLLSDVIAINASIDIVMGEIDR